MKLRIKDCKHCGKQYGAENGNQLYCCDVCRQQAYYKRHGIDRSQRPEYLNYVNRGFTPINALSDNNDVNRSISTFEPIKPAPVMEVKPLIETSVKTLTNDHFGAIVEQMNKTHQAQMEAMETRLKLSFAQQTHEREKQVQDELILKLQKEIEDMSKKSDINTSVVLSGLSNMIGGANLQDMLKTKS